MQTSTNVIAPKSGAVYYAGQYWNDFPAVRKEINKRATGNTKTEWFDDFFNKYPGPYKRVLIINCGNGWLERLLYEKGYIQETVAVDYSTDLIKVAKQQSKKLPFRYYRMDINTAKFPESNFDLIINHAAAHHIANVNKVFCELLRISTKDAVFVNYDYVGPHRNQYDYLHWFESDKLNKTLHESTRQTMSYPHLPTMMVDDPSEAIHSELILPTMQRYFKPIFFRPIGGALAYPILTHNSAIQNADKKEVDTAVKIIMSADKKFLKKFPDSTYFAYWVSTPKKEILRQKKKLKEWQDEEDTRELAARKNEGQYYDLELVQKLYQDMDKYRIEALHKQDYIDQMHRQNDKRKYVKRTIMAARNNKVTRKLSRVRKRLRA